MAGKHTAPTNWRQVAIVAAAGVCTVAVVLAGWWSIPDPRPKAEARPLVKDPVVVVEDAPTPAPGETPDGDTNVWVERGNPPRITVIRPRRPSPSPSPSLSPQPPVVQAVPSPCPSGMRPSPTPKVKVKVKVVVKVKVKVKVPKVEATPTP